MCKLRILFLLLLVKHFQCIHVESSQNVTESYLIDSTSKTQTDTLEELVISSDKQLDLKEQPKSVTLEQSTTRSPLSPLLAMEFENRLHQVLVSYLLQMLNRTASEPILVKYNGTPANTRTKTVYNPSVRINGNLIQNIFVCNYSCAYTLPSDSHLATMRIMNAKRGQMSNISVQPSKIPSSAKKIQKPSSTLTGTIDSAVTHKPSSQTDLIAVNIAKLTKQPPSTTPLPQTTEDSDKKSTETPCQTDHGCAKATPITSSSELHLYSSRTPQTSGTSSKSKWISSNRGYQYQMASPYENCREYHHYPETYYLSQSENNQLRSPPSTKRRFPRLLRNSYQYVQHKLCLYRDRQRLLWQRFFSFFSPD